MPVGTVKFFNSTKGFGFIQPDGRCGRVRSHLRRRARWDAHPDGRTRRSASRSRRTAGPQERSPTTFRRPDPPQACDHGCTGAGRCGSTRGRAHAGLSFFGHQNGGPTDGHAANYRGLFKQTPSNPKQSMSRLIAPRARSSKTKSRAGNPRPQSFVPTPRCRSKGRGRKLRASGSCQAQDREAREPPRRRPRRSNLRRLAGGPEAARCCCYRITTISVSGA